MVADLLQIAGAILILAGYGGAQAGRLDQKSYAYLLANLVGSALLAALAYADEQWGFLLLEGVWALISAWGLATLLRAPRHR